MADEECVKVCLFGIFDKAANCLDASRAQAILPAKNIKGHLCKALMWISTPFLLRPPLEGINRLLIIQIQGTREPSVNGITQGGRNLSCSSIT
ncbi:hypothetical protein PGT21_004110 [Puccinia graminis f. sp. tritici]|uniref:Uncharacterized protein n=1 Tax=Puccinia graminis f. sp. tritici TaxID=56615 RepID=A0A5B0QHW5_PUCGR|nr:hypothetical protein PGT21_004110 [Puccinia graminis f. sp. tritici]